MIHFILEHPLLIFQEQAVTDLKAQIEQLSKQLENPAEEEASEELLKLRTENAKLQYQKIHLERVRQLLNF